MSDVIYLRPMVPPIERADVQAMADHASGCFHLHRVDWLQSLLATDGGRMLCWYRAPDAESVRWALRDLGSDMSAVWAGSVVGEPPVSPPDASESRVVAELSFADRVSDGPLRVLQQAITAAFETGGLTPTQVFTATTGARIVCVTRGKDESAVARALHSVDLDPSPVWCAVPLTPKLPPGVPLRKS